MQKIHFTRKEKIALLIAGLIFIALFISSSMTYHEQKLSTTTLNHHFSLLENLLKDLTIVYGGVTHNVKTDGTAGFTQFFIRKLAHFSSFFILASSLFVGLKRLFFNKILAVIFIFPVPVLVAVFDEYHQFLTGDRTPSVHDVVLDSTGAICGIAIWLLIEYLFKKYHKKNNEIGNCN